MRTNKHVSLLDDEVLSAGETVLIVSSLSALLTNLVAVEQKI